jgi:hypothetical protein
MLEQRPMHERRSGFWSGIGTGVALEVASWVLFLLGFLVVRALELPWGFNIGLGVLVVVAIVLGLRRYGVRH